MQILDWYRRRRNKKLFDTGYLWAVSKNREGMQLCEIQAFAEGGKTFDPSSPFDKGILCWCWAMEEHRRKLGL